MQHNTWRENPFSASSADERQWKCLHSILLPETVHGKEMHKVSTDLSASSSFMHEYFDTIVKADQGAQNVDDIVIEAYNATDLTRNIRTVFE